MRLPVPDDIQNTWNNLLDLDNVCILQIQLDIQNLQNITKIKF